MGRRIRRAGHPWRLLVHEYVGGQSPTYGTSHGVEPQPGEDRKWYRHHELPASVEFDELVVGKWCHIEQMDTGLWWMNIGGVTLWVTADRDGNPKHVTVFAPGDYAEPVEGCQYDGAVAITPDPHNIQDPDEYHDRCVDMEVLDG